MPDKENAQVLVPAIPYGKGTSMVKNSQDRSSSSNLTPPVPTLDLPNTQTFSEMREASLQNQSAQVVLH